MLKWPNDVMLLGKKLAGILLERSGDRVAVGFGVNLASAPQLPDRAGRLARRARSRRKPSRPCSPAALRACSACGGRASRHCSPRRGLPALTRSARRSRSIRAPTKRVSGRFDGIEPDGALRLRRDDGSLEIVRAGDVEL